MSVDIDAGLDQARAVADPVRWRILELLAREQLCVCHLTEELELAQPLVSHHLRVLRDAGLVDGERFRYWTYYRLLPDGLGALARQLDDWRASAPDTSDRRRPCC